MEEQEVEKKIEESLAIVRTETQSIPELKELRITGQPTLEKSAEGLKMIGKVSKIIKAEKEKNINPLKKVIENIKEFWAPFEKDLAEAENNLKSEQRKYSEKLKAKEEVEKARINEAFEKGEVSEKDIEKSGKKLEAIEEKSSLIKTYTYTGVRIVDKAKVPLQYLDPNETEIKNALQSGIVVPGAELYTEERVKK
jgi:hypothetical protein